MSFRKEYKFKLNSYEIIVLKSQLITRGMTQLHDQRKINSMYFDTKDFKLYSDSEEGLLPRSKYRVRWYNNDTQKKLEEKFSSIEGRFKTSKSITDDYFKVISQKGLFKNDYGLLFPSMLVSYTRDYYSFADLRITFDTQIFYASQLSNFKIQLRDTNFVVEVKTSIGCSEGYVFKHLPYSTSRFSKYCRAFRIHEKSM